ncbi:MAG: hypothetical protein IJN70_09270 [Clostridia bacterium]|nr:hypothetical protein [Clostridia bacterium]
MNEENKIPGVSGEEKGVPAENTENTPVNAENGASLDEELESLRETFQEKYDETVEEAAAMPVIQELEEGEDREDADEEGDEESNISSQEKTPKKKKKIGKIIAITIPVLLLVLVIGSLLAFVIASVTNPNFSSFISTYAQATAAEKYEDKMEYFEQALTYCQDKDSAFQQAMASAIHEEIALAVYNEEGYAAAYSYMVANMSKEQLESPSLAELKKLVKTVDAVNKLSLEAFNKVYENLGDADKVPAADVLANGLAIPEGLEEDIAPLLSAIAEGYIMNRTADSVESKLHAMNYYANAYSGFSSLGADSRQLAEKMVVDLYNKGYLIEAVSFASVALDPNKEDVNKDYIALKEEIAAYENFGISVISAAEEAVASEKTAEKDVLALVKSKAELTDAQAEVVTAFVMYAIEGVNVESEKNLTRAQTVYATLTSVLEAFGMDDIKAHLKTATVIFDSGNLNDASTLVSAYLTDEAMKDATAEQKAQCDRMNKVFEALAATSEVFSPYYSAYYQQGTEIDLEALKGEMDKLLAENSDNYMEGFANYCLYIAAVSSGKDAEAKQYLSEMSELMPDLPFIYGYSYIADYITEGNFNAAYSYAQKLLSINVADEYANSVVALYYRVKGDLEGAEQAALKGIELSGSDASDCAQQLAIVNMLKGDFETAFGYVSAVYNANQSMEAFELVLIFNALYKGDNADLKTSLNEMVSIVNQTYSYYGLSSYAETKAVIDGTKTLEDVFMSGDYTITAES